MEGFSERHELFRSPAKQGIQKICILSSFFISTYVDHLQHSLDWNIHSYLRVFDIVFKNKVMAH